MSDLTQEQLKAVLDYDPESGIFTWKQKVARTVEVGERAGRIARYSNRAALREIDIGGRTYTAHQLALLWDTGVYPSNHVVHLNGDKDDNRIANLREVGTLKKGEDITQAELKSMLHYDPETGGFTWLISNSARAPAGSKANSVSGGGYYQIRIRGRRYFAHRLAWLYVYGKFPDNSTDHINGNRLDNRIENLRDVTDLENQHNQRRAHSCNKTKYLGVSTQSRTGKFRAAIQVRGEHIYLGLFDTPEEASQAYIEAKRRLHSTCTI